MITAKLQTRNNSNAGTLGLIVRSTGYLQGGYKDTTLWSTIQLFNTITQVGAIVTDTGYQKRYTPGISGNYFGYYSINTTTLFNKYNYISATSANSFTLSGVQPKSTAFDFGAYSQAWITVNTDSAEWTGGNILSTWYKLNLSTDTTTSYTLSPNPLGTTRQALNTAQMAGFVDTTNLLFVVLNYTSQTVSNSLANSNLSVATMQLPCGMAKDVSTAYFVGYQVNMKVSIAGAAITAITSTTSYGYMFGESHSVTSDTKGFMMAGYYDTSGRYGGSQHGLCQSITFASDAITTLSDLVTPQSSGQMMQGF
jgi:hypothetical protein